jgi:RNA polymerase sigma-B factor
VTDFLPLSRRLASRYRASSETREDLEQVAAMGLLKAIDRYEPAAGPFLHYAVPTIVGELKRYFRDKGWAIRVGRVLQERILAVDAATEELTAALGHSPSPREVARAAGLTVEEVVEAMEASTAYDWCALDAPLAESREDGLSLGDALGAVDRRYELFELTHSVAPVVMALPKRDRAILHLRFVEDLTQAEIGQRVGCSQMQVSRLIRRSLHKLEVAAQASGCIPG